MVYINDYSRDFEYFIGIRDVRPQVTCPLEWSLAAFFLVIIIRGTGMIELIGRVMK